MKIRSDFVSNSSSSSFLISTNSNYATNDLISDISDKCKCDYWDNKTKMTKILNNYVSLFAGYIRLDDIVTDYDKNNPDDVYMFEWCKQQIDSSTNTEDQLKIKYLNDEHTIIRVQEPSYDSRIVTKDHMKKIMELEGDELIKYIKNRDNFTYDKIDGGYSCSYIINEDSVAITEKLMKLGKQFSIFDNNKLTFENIKDRILNKKEKIYVIHVNYDGDGCDEDRFRAEEHGVFDGLNVEMLNTEPW